MGNIINRTLENVINVDALSYAMYTVESRAIPNMIDGFKPVQRFMIYRAMQMGKPDPKKYHKLASVAGGVADAGYHHGEVSAQDAGALIANTWNNNVPFLDGSGNFGSRLVQKAAESRYVFCRLSENFRKIYKDTNIAPVHPDEDHLPPKFYLPIIPTVLLNGVRGIATGYATNILPHSLASVIECTRAIVNGLDDVPEPEVSYPRFSGPIIHEGNGKYQLHGKYEFVSKNTIYISEVPYSFDRTSYIEILDKLEDSGFITYDDDCSQKGFGFKVKFRKEYNLPTDKEDAHAKIMKDFALIEKLSQNIVVIDENGRLNDKLGTAKNLTEAFVKVRLSFIEKRIEYMKEECDRAFKLALAKAVFIRDVNAGSIIIKGKTRSQLKEELSAIRPFTGFENELVSMNIYHMTEDEVESLKQKAHAAREEFDYWSNTTPLVEYNKDLDELQKIV